MSHKFIRLRLLFPWLTGLLAALLVIAASAPAPSIANDTPPPVFVNSASWAPYVNAYPTADGTGLYVSAGGVGVWSSPVYGAVSVVGPTAHDRSHTLTYDSGTESYTHLFDALFTPQVGAEGSIRITSTHSLSGTVDSGPVSYRRAFVSLADTVDLVSNDGLFSVHLVGHSFPADAYTVIMPTNAPPGPLPFNYTQVGSPYAFHASGAVTVTESPGVLRMYYTTETLGDVDPNALSIHAWDATNKRWDDLGGDLNQSQGYLSLATQRLTVYALMAPRGPIYNVYLPVVQR